MPTRRAFLDAICADPDSDLPRLVYADWLDDRGGHRRAEFIRARCELARLPDGDPRRAALAGRAEALFDPAWLPPGWEPTPGRAWDYESTGAEFLTASGRGGFDFVGAGARLTLGAPLRNGGRGPARRQPVARPSRGARGRRRRAVGRRVRAARGRRDTRWSAGETFPELLASPHLRSLRLLELYRLPLNTAGFRALCESPAPLRLAGLDLTASLGSAFSGHAEDDLGVAGAARLLAGCPRLAGLESLMLYYNGPREADIRALAASPVLSPTLRLELREDRWAVPADLAELLRRRFAGGVRLN